MTRTNSQLARGNRVEIGPSFQAILNSLEDRSGNCEPPKNHAREDQENQPHKYNPANVGRQSDPQRHCESTYND